MDKLFAIIIATYKRKNGKSFEYLTRASKMLSEQTYKDFFIYLIGDNYEDQEEFERASKLFGDRIYSENLPTSFREGTFNIRRNKWTCGGMLARKRGIEKAIEDGYNFYVHLDDDDIWNPNHLEVLHEHIEKYEGVDFLYTRSKYKDIVLPRNNIQRICINNLPPGRCNVVHSSTCLNLKTIGPPLLNLFENRLNLIEKIKRKETPERSLQPFDIEKWKMIREKNFRTLYISIITCQKDSDVNVP